MRVVSPHGMVERLNDHRPRPQRWSHYGRRKEGAPKEPRSIELAARQDRRDQARSAIDPLRGRLFDLTT